MKIPARFFLSIFFFTTANCQLQLSPEYKLPEDCPNDQYFLVSQLKCLPCPENQKKGPEGVDCVCADGFRTIENFGGTALSCEQCPAGTVPTPDGQLCRPCAEPNKPHTGAGCAPCEHSLEILYYRNVFGQPETQQQCSKCRQNTTASKEKLYCQPCNPSIHGINCECTDGQISGGVCFQSSFKPDFQLPTPPPSSIIEYTNGDKVTSAYGKEHLRASIPLCRRGNVTSCQLLANMCVLNYYNSPDGLSPCKQLEDFQGPTGVGTGSGRPYWLPEIVTPQLNPGAWLTRTDITTSFTFKKGEPNSKLELVTAVYTLSGQFKGLQPVTGGTFQLCKGPQQVLDAAYTFGQKYRQRCQISARSLWDATNDTEELQFYELYLKYEDNNAVQRLFPIYILNLNQELNPTKQPTNFDGRASWLLSRRFFMVDNVAGRDDDIANPATIVRYPAFIQLNIELRNTKDGKIYPPYLTIRYDEIRRDQYESNPSLPVQFVVEYYMNTGRHEKDLEITMGVLCSFGALWAMLRAWSWSKRAGKAVIDFPTVLKCLLYLCGTIADIFFIVMLGTCLWLTFAYKAQLTVVYMLLTSSQETSFVIYLSLAGALKAIEMIHLLLEQVTAETLFIDWERPRGHVIPSTIETPQRAALGADEGAGLMSPSPGNQSVVKDKMQSPITIYRTYMIANEWNELQSYRKTSYVMQLFLMVLFLKVVNFEALTIVGPGGSLEKVPDEFQSSKMTRFAVAASLYLLIGFVQWFINVFIIERCIVDHFRSFMDLCSISNISVLCLTRPQFGYYIHGRSVHGHADTNMREMNEMLQRERDNLTSHRGLEPNTDNQCFVVCLPTDFREEYEKILAPLRNPNAAINRMTGVDAVTAKAENIIQVYNSMNLFITSFLDKQLATFASYAIQDRTFFESVLDIEFPDTSQMGIFYRDPTESAYNSAFLYGQEWIQLSFDCLLFCVADLIFQNFLVAAVITYAVVSGIRKFRELGGTKRLIKTSLVDDRFLI